MNPEDNANFVDLILDVNFDKSKELASVLEGINRGQAVVFNATLKGLHVTSPNRLHLVDSRDSGRPTDAGRVPGDPGPRGDE